MAKPTISLGWLRGSGIIVVLFVIGLVLHLSHILDPLGAIAIGFSVLIAIIYALLGIGGILRRLGL